ALLVFGALELDQANRKRSRRFKAGPVANRKGDPKAALAVSRAERRQSSIGGRPVATRSTLSISSCFSYTRPRQCSKPCPFPYRAPLSRSSSVWATISSATLV